MTKNSSTPRTAPIPQQKSNHLVPNTDDDSDPLGCCQGWPPDDQPYLTEHAWLLESKESQNMNAANSPKENSTNASAKTFFCTGSASAQDLLRSKCCETSTLGQRERKPTYHGDSCWRQRTADSDQLLDCALSLWGGERPVGAQLDSAVTTLIKQSEPRSLLTRLWRSPR